MTEPCFFSELEPGLFLVMYEDPANMNPNRQGALVAALEKAALRGRTGLCFRVSDTIPRVRLEVPSFWLGITARADLNLCAMAIASRSVGVQMAAKGFGFSNRLRRIPIEVQTFDDVQQARGWVHQKLVGHEAKATG
ncbi:MAG: hypothetical protein QM765_14095 [Myxococcales bacterium]